MIETGVLKVGDDLPTERDMAERFGVSRNTFREAVKRLEAYGIVETRQRHGARITNNSVDAMIEILSFRLGSDDKTFRDVQSFRRVLETGLVGDIVKNCTSDDIRDLTDINDRLKGGGAVVTLAEIDLSFHKRLLAVSRNETAVKIYEVLSGVILQIMTIGKARGGSSLAHRSHAELIEVLERRDTAEFHHLLSQHMGLGFRYLDELDEAPKPP